MFTIAAQCGLSPNDMLDMNLPTLRAAISGYQDHLFDLKCLSVLSGYWAGYYSGNSKRKPKPVDKVLEELHAAHVRRQGADVAITKPKLDVDVEKFKRTEQQFRARLREE